MDTALTIAVWTVFFIPASFAVTLIASRLLAVRRGWLALGMAGALGWTGGLLIAGALTDWQWSQKEMVLLTLLFGTLLTMVFAVGMDMLTAPSAFADGGTGPFAFLPLFRRYRAAVAPIGRYRQLLRLARVNGLLRRPPNFNDEDAVVALGPPLRRTLEDAGGMFVKLGQVASTRTDLLPPALCSELALLQSSAAPAPRADVEAELERELGASVDTAFTSFDWNPIASASVAQVYAATLPDGTPVVVKVERPGIGDVIQSDTAVLDQVAAAIDNHTNLGLSIKPRDLADEFVAGVREELDFTIEANNARALAAATPNDCGVRLPRVYPELSTARVLVEERITGVKIDDIAALRAQGHDPAALAHRLLDVTLNLVFDAGIFHADPHPGNILVEADGTIVLIDLGAVGRLGKHQQQLFVELLAGATTGDSEIIREALDAAGLIEGNVKGYQLDGALDEFLARHVGTGARVDSSIIEEMFQMLAQYDIHAPRWMTTIGRMFVTLEGTLRAVDPNFSLIDEAMQIAQQRMTSMPRPDSVREMLQNEAARQIPRLRRIPQRLDDLLGQASRGRLTARISIFADDEDLHTITRLVDRAVLSILAAAMGVGSALLLNVNSGPVVSGSVSVTQVIGYIGLAVSAVLGLRVVAAIVRDGVT